MSASDNECPVTLPPEPGSRWVEQAVMREPTGTRQDESGLVANQVDVMVLAACLGEDESGGATFDYREGSKLDVDALQRDGPSHDHFAGLVAVTAITVRCSSDELACRRHLSHSRRTGGGGQALSDSRRSTAGRLAPTWTGSPSVGHIKRQVRQQDPAGPTFWCSPRYRAGVDRGSRHSALRSVVRTSESRRALWQTSGHLAGYRPSLIRRTARAGGQSVRRHHDGA